MKSPSPAFSLYPKDILSDGNATAMTHEEFGAYVRLLCHAWLEGSIPKDPVRLARLLRVSPNKLKRIWPAIESCWNEAENDRLIQLRLEEERIKQQERSTHQSRRGSKGGRPFKSTKEESRGFIPGKPEISRTKPEKSLASPSPSSSPKTNENESTNAWTKDAAREALEDYFTARGRLEGKAEQRIAIRINQEIAPLAKRHGWQVVRPGWQKHLATEGKWACPEKFAEQPARWFDAAKVPSTTPSVPAVLPRQLRERDDIPATLEQIRAAQGIK